MGKEPEFVGGLRVTDAETMEIVEMVLAGQRRIHRAGRRRLVPKERKRVGLSGKDAGLFTAVKGHQQHGDLGFVGRITLGKPGHCPHVDCKPGYIPVISSVAIGDRTARRYNVNADTAAGALAVALKAEKFILMTDVEGLYRDFSDKSSLIHEITPSEVTALMATGAVDKGMIPKLAACIEAVEDGVPRATILDGRRPHSLLIETFTDTGIGTMITRRNRLPPSCSSNESERKNEMTHNLSFLTKNRGRPSSINFPKKRSFGSAVWGGGH